MKLTIDNREIEARTGQTLLERVKALGLDTDRLATRPLAAKIAGETFTLNYVPVRRKEELDPANPQRRAMAASGGKIKLLHYSLTTPAGMPIPGRSSLCCFWPCGSSTPASRPR